MNGEIRSSRNRPRTLDDGGGARTSSLNSNEHFAIHEKFPEALATDEPTASRPSPPPAASPSDGVVETAERPAAEPPTASPTAGPPSGGAIGGRAFLDFNSNGIYDGEDDGVGDVAAWLFSCDGATVGNAKTSPEGWFRWDGLAWGNYFVVVQLPGGYSTTTSTMWDGDVFDAAERMAGGADGGTICFAIREGPTSAVELSFGMGLAPTTSPTPRPSAGPSGNPSASRAPSGRPSSGPSRGPSGGPSSGPSRGPSGGPSTGPSRPRPSPAPTLSPSLPNETTISAAASGSPSVPPTTDRRPHLEPPRYPSHNQQPSDIKHSHYPTRRGEIVGPIRSNGLRIVLFGIDEVRNEAEWNDGMALYIHRHFNFERNYAFDVDVDVVLTRQTTKLDSLGEFVMQYGHRRLRSRTSVEITYDQVSTYKAIDPTFANVAYVLRDPFAATTSRCEYASFLRRLSPGNYANVSSVSPVMLPPRQQLTTSPDRGNAKKGFNLRIFSFVIGVIALVLTAQFAFVHRKRRRRKSSKPAIKDGEREEENDHERTDGVRSPRRSSSSRDARPPRPLTGSSATDATRTTASGSNFSEIMLEIIVPPGRVGFIIDDCPRRGPYICEVHEFSPLRDKLRLGDRILYVDGDDVRQRSAVSVSKLLGRRGENEERRMTILREFTSCDHPSARDDSRSGMTESGSDEDDDGDEEESKTSVDPPGVRW